MNMSWQKILKVEDIDFDGAIEGFGHYSMAVSHPTPERMAELLFFGSQTGKAPALKDFIEEEIRINHKNAYQYLKQRNEREPTEKEITEFIIRTIMHEATHAAMGFEQQAMADHQREYGAFTGQFPNETYYRLKSFVMHPATEPRLLHPMLEQLLEIQGTIKIDAVDKVKDIIGFVDALTSDLDAPSSKIEEFKEKFARLEIQARGQGKSLIRDIDKRKVGYDFFIDRYGEENKDFIMDYVSVLMGRKMTAEDFERAEKMAGTVTTTSAPAMFNKVVRGRKKKKKRDE
jgi:hypothetical protein|tara:strand:- start:334 stop:1197 length:864 start_codon:yes stop_codon:yes gene_type:complete